MENMTESTAVAGELKFVAASKANTIKVDLDFTARVRNAVLRKLEEPGNNHMVKRAWLHGSELFIKVRTDGYVGKDRTTIFIARQAAIEQIASATCRDSLELEHQRMQRAQDARRAGRSLAVVS
jgi:hypothetical protein